MTDDFESFCIAAHQKRVDHYTDYCKSNDRPPTIADAIAIFGFCKKDVKPIVEDTIKAIAESTEWD